MRISDWSSDVCSSDLAGSVDNDGGGIALGRRHGGDASKGGNGGAAGIHHDHFPRSCRGDQAADRKIRPVEITQLAPYMPGGAGKAGDSSSTTASLYALRYALDAQRVPGIGPSDRKSVVSGQSVSVRVDPGGSRHIKKKHNKKPQI